MIEGLVWGLNYMADNTIHLERQSVCMGDDATAPNAKNFSFESDMMLSDFLDEVAESIPLRFNGQHTIWCVENNKRPIALLEADEAGNYTKELLIEDLFLKDMVRKEIYCRYFYDYQGSLCSSLSQYIDGKWKDKFPECKTLSDKVKALYGMKV